MAGFTVLRTILLSFLFVQVNGDAAKSKSTSTTTSSASQSSQSDQYTWTLIKNGKGQPTTPISTATMTAITVTDTAGTPQFTGFVNKKGVVGSGIVVTDANNTGFLFGNKKGAQIQIFHPEGQRAIVDSSGVTIWNAQGDQQLHLPIPNLPSVIQSGVSSSAPSGPSSISIGRRNAMPTGAMPLSPRDSPSPYVDLEVDYFDQCGKPITGHVAYASCDFENPITGFSDTQSVNLVSSNGNPGAYTGSCKSPSQNWDSDVDKCKDTIKNIFNWLSGGWLGQLTNAQGDLKRLNSLVRNGYVADAIGLALLPFNIPAIATGIELYGLFQGFVQAGGDDLVANLLCNSLNEMFMEVESYLDTEGGSAVQVAYQSSKPFTAVTATRTVSIATISSCTTSSTSTSSSSPTPTSLPCARSADDLCPSSACVDKICGTDYWGLSCLCEMDATNTTICFTGVDPCRADLQCQVNSDCAKFGSTFRCFTHVCTFGHCAPGCSYNPNSPPHKKR